MGRRGEPEDPLGINAPPSGDSPFRSTVAELAGPARRDHLLVVARSIPRRS